MTKCFCPIFGHYIRHDNFPFLINQQKNAYHDHGTKLANFQQINLQNLSKLKVIKSYELIQCLLPFPPLLLPKLHGELQCFKDQRE